MTAMPRYTLVICTCDAYEDAWYPLFTLFRKYWPTLDVPIVLNTETKSYQHEGFNIICPQLYKGHPNPRTIPWSKLLRETLERVVSTELVMLFLEDFYLQSPVNTERLDICLQLIEQNSRIANFALCTCTPPYTPLSEFPWIVKRAKKLQWLGYLFSLQAGLWRTKRLLHFLRDHESPWDFEIWGSLRALRYPDEFYGLALVDGKQSVFDYEHGIIRGKWKSVTMELFAKEGIQVDTSIRGVMPANWRAPKPRRNWLRTAWKIFRSLRP